MTREELARQVLQELESMRDEARKKDIMAFRKLKKVISDFKHWMEEGLPGACPVDLSQYSLKTPGWQTLMQEASSDSTVHGDGQEVSTDVVQEATAEDEVSEVAEVEIRPWDEKGWQEDDWFHQLREMNALLQRQKFQEVIDRGKALLEKNPPEEVVQALQDLIHQAEQNLRHEWMTQAQQAWEQGDWEQTLKLVDKVLVWFEDDKEAKDLREEALKALERDRFVSGIQAWTARAQELLDKGPSADLRDLEETVRLGEDLLKEGQKKYPNVIESPEGAHFQEFLIRVRQVFDEKRKQQSQVTTSAAVEEYETVVRGIEQMEEALRAGQKTWYDDRVGQPRPIHELLDEFRERLPELAKETAMRYQARAQTYLDLHKPREALENIEQALALKGLPGDVRQALEQLKIRAEEEYKAYQKADEFIDQALKAPDPREARRFLQEAEHIYAYHERLPEARIEVLNQSQLWLERHFAEVLQEQLPALLKKEAFAEARGLLNQLQEEVVALLPQEETTPWISRIDSARQKIELAERRRQEIDAWVEDMQRLLEQERFAEAWKRFQLKLQEQPDWEDDVKVRQLYEDLRVKVGDQEKLNEARRLYARGRFDEAERILEEIHEAAFRKEARRLLGEIRLARARVQLRRLYERKKYREFEQRYRSILREDALTPEQREEFQEEIQPLLQEIEKLRENDPLVLSLLQEVNIADADALLALPQIIQSWDKSKSNVDLAWQWYQRLKQLADQPSTLQGSIQDARDALADWLRKTLRELLNRWAEDQRWEEVEEWLERWYVEWSMYEREWYEELYERMYTHQAQQAEQEGNWKRVEEIWNKAYTRFKTYRFRQAKRDAKQKALLQSLLTKLFQEEPSSSVESVVNELLKLEHYARENAEVRFALDLVNHLQHLERNWTRRQMDAIAQLVRAITKDLPAKLKNAVILREKDVLSLIRQKIDRMYQTLLQEGDRARDEGDISGAVLAYAQALLLPLSADQEEEMRGRIQPYKERGVQLVQELLDSAEKWRFDPELDLQEQIQGVQQLRRRLQAMILVLPLLIDEEDEREQWKEELEIRLRLLSKVYEWLTRASELVEAYQPTDANPRWVDLVQNAEWNKVEGEIQNRILGWLRTLLQENPELHRHLDSETLPAEMEALRSHIQSLQQHKQRLEHGIQTFRQLWSDENFDEALDQMRKLQGLVEEGGSQWNETERAYFRDLLDREMIVWDRYDGKMKKLRGPEIEDRLVHLQRNQAAWLAWKAQIEGEVNRWEGEYEDLELLEKDGEGMGQFFPGALDVTQQKALRFGEAASKINEAARQLDETQRPQESPITKKARKAQEEGEALLERLKTMRDHFQQGYERYFLSLEDIIRQVQSMIVQGQFDEAERWIRGASRYLGFDHPFLKRLLHVIEDRRKQAQLPRWKRWLQR